ncbi:hypothetical protein CHUAL_006510 [Chamberlinius hualienensis]
MFILFLVISLGSAVAQQDSVCRYRTYSKVLEATSGISNCTYATENFNPNCVEASLPALSSQSLCPVNSDGSINEDNFKQILKIVEDILKLPEICNKSLNTIPIPTFSCEASQLLPKSLSGECTVVMNKNNNITNVKNTQVSLINSPENGQAIVWINGSITYYAVAECQLILENDSHIDLNISMEIHVNIYANISIAINNNNSTFAINSIDSKTNPGIAAFNNSLLTGVRQYYKVEVTDFIQNSTIPSSFVNFISTIAADCITASAKKCLRTK